MADQNQKDISETAAKEQKVREVTDKEQTNILRHMSTQQSKGINVSKVIATAEFALLGVLIVVFIFLVPRFLKTVNRVEETMDAVDKLIAHAETSMSEVTDLAVDTDLLIRENESEVNVALKNFNSVDFESLNHSISNLAKIMEPLVKIVQILKE